MTRNLLEHRSSLRGGWAALWVRNAVSRGALCALALAPAVGLAQSALADHPPSPLRDQKIELSMKIEQPFTVVSVGDMIQMTRISVLNDPRIQYLMDLMRGADMTTANNENTIVNFDTFTGKLSHMEAPAIIADDWASMGIKMVNRANNQAFDDGDDGIIADFQELDRVGIVHVGAGRTMSDARLAGYYTTPKGTVCMVGVYADSKTLNAVPLGPVVTVTEEQLRELRAMRDSIVARRHETSNPIIVPPPDPQGETTVWGVIFHVPGASAAPPPTGDVFIDNAFKRAMAYAKVHGGKMPNAKKPEMKYSVDTLRLTGYIGVTASQLEQLRKIAKVSGSGPTLDAFGLHFEVTAKPGGYRYTMDPQDEREILRQIRTGKQFSQFEIVQAHWHQNRYAFQAYSFDHYPASFEIQFAHEAIDQGADEFVAHGVHTLKGIEIYKGKPIFYGISNFVVQESIVHSWRDWGVQDPVPPTGLIVGEGQENELEWHWMLHPDNLDAVLVRTQWDKGKLIEVQIYPVDLGGPDRPFSELGIPERPSPARAREILEKVSEYSKPFGTKIEINNGIGIIHVTPET